MVDPTIISNITFNDQYSIPKTIINNDNMSNCIPIIDIELDAIILRINFDTKYLVEIHQIQLMIISNNTIENIVLYTQTFDITTNRFVIINGSYDVVNDTLLSEIYLWQTDIAELETDIPLSESTELYLHNINSSLLDICSIMIDGNIIQSISVIENKDLSLCLICNDCMNGNNYDYDHFGTYDRIDTTSSYFETKTYKNMNLDVEQWIYKHSSLYLFIFKLDGIGWILVDNLPFINPSRQTNIYLTCFCVFTESCLLSQCGLNKWYLGFNQTKNISSFQINTESCLSLVFICI